MKYKILFSKIQIPEMQKNLIIRERLLKRIDSFTQKMIILHGTVGYGKTVLMSHYIRLYEEPCAWYHLDEMDNSVITFFEYISAAFAGVWEDFSFDVSGYPEVSGRAALEQIALDFIIYLNEFLKRPEYAQRKVILVLDDFQVIESQEIFSVIQLLTAYSYRNLKLLLATKSSLPEFAAAFLVRDEASLVEMDELAFTREEVSGVLEKILHQDVLPQVSSSVHRLVEGWPAGTMFMAQYFKRNGGPEDQPDWDFISHDAFIQNYIMNELYRRLPYDIQQFLVKTSVLDELSVELCNYALNRTDARPMLNYLLQENLFVLRINKRSGYYRYHSIFKMFLQRAIFPEQRKEVLDRSAQWYMKKGNVDRAMECWMRSKNYCQAAECFVQFGEKMAAENPEGVVLEFLKAFHQEDFFSSFSAEADLKRRLNECAAQVEKLLEGKTRQPLGTLKVRFFGGFEVSVGDEGYVMSWRTKKTAELFAYLVCRQGKPVKRDELLKLLWPEDFPNNAVAMLHNMLYNIRRELAPFGQNDRIRYVNKEYSMDMAGITTDLDLICKLCQAVEKKNTDFLERHLSSFENYWGIFLDGIENSWCSLKKYYYEKCFLDGCALLGRSFMDKGDYDGAEQVLKAGLEVDAYSESMALMLMQCYARRSQRREGKRFYENLCRIYRTDLGITPGQGFVRAYEECIHG